MTRSSFLFLFLLSCSVFANPQGSSVLTLVIAKVAIAQENICGLLYCYDEVMGICANEDGEEGFNEISEEQLMETKNGQCADFRKTDICIKQLYGGFDLRGAILRDFKLGYAGQLINTKLHGTDMSGILWHDQHSYPELNGEIDEYTIVGEDNYCEEEEVDGKRFVYCYEGRRKFREYCK